jgi:hypothetical protein
MCPIITAAMAEGKMKNKIPHIKLTIASPLVSGARAATGWEAVEGVVAVGGAA